MSREWTLPASGAKEADVREPARQSSDRGLGDVEAEALIANAGPDAHERGATPIRAEG